LLFPDCYYGSEVQEVLGLIKLILYIIILSLIYKYVLPRDRTRIRNMWLSGTILMSVGDLLFANGIFSSLKLYDLYLSISIGLLLGIIWVYLIYRNEKK